MSLGKYKVIEMDYDIALVSKENAYSLQNAL